MFMMCLVVIVVKVNTASGLYYHFCVRTVLPVATCFRIVFLSLLNSLAKMAVFRVF